MKCIQFTRGSVRNNNIRKNYSPPLVFNQLDVKRFAFFYVFDVLKVSIAIERGLRAMMIFDLDVIKSNMSNDSRLRWIAMPCFCELIWLADSAVGATFL